MSTTPRPWGVEEKDGHGFWIRGNDGRFVADTWAGSHRMMDDATTIVRAVNAYDALVTENRELREALKDAVSASGTVTEKSETFAKLLVRLEAALQRAEKGEKP